MKKIITIISACTMLAASCDSKWEATQENSTAQDSALIPVTLQVNGIQTKATGELPTDELIKDLQVFVYTVGSEGEKTYDSYYSFGSDAAERVIYIDSNCEADSYWIAAYANHPKIEIGESLKDWSLFSNESVNSFQMAGKCEKTAEKIKTDKKVEIELIRQCSKVSVKEIEVDWTNTANRYKTFKLKGMYLMDVPGVIKNYFELDSAVGSDNSLWQNKNGHNSNSQDALLYDSIADVTVSEEVPYTTDHFFYGYLDPSTTYNSDAAWAPGGTRLVIEAEFNGKACYYAVALNGIGDNRTIYTDLRNMHIEFSKITITRPGADSPYEALPDESPVNVSVSVQTWQPGFSGNYTIE